MTSALSTSTDRYTSAAAIPPELYDLILHFLEDGRAMDAHRGEQEQRNRVVIGMGELGQLALVCRSWASICQKKMFRCVILRSLDDLRGLESILSHRCSRISRYIRHLQLHAGSATRPWIHTVCLQVSPLSTVPERPGAPFPHYTGHYLILFGKGALEVLKHGLHAALPKRVPGIFSQGITQLFLGRIELPDLGEVVRLSRELPSLVYLAFWNVIGAATPSTEAEIYAAARVPLLRRRPAKKCALAKRIEMYGSAEAWVALPVLCLFDTSRPLCTDDLAAVAKIVQTLTVSVEKAGHSTPMTRAKLKEWGYALSVRAAWDQYLAPWLYLATVQDATLSLWRGDIVALDFLPGKNETMPPLADMVGYDWEGFDIHTASLPALRHVIIALATRDDLTFFVKEFESKLIQLRSSRRIKYALESTYYYKDGRLVAENGWIACRPGDADEDLVNAKRVANGDLLWLYS